VCATENIKMAESCVSRIISLFFELVSKNYYKCNRFPQKVIHKEHEILFFVRHYQNLRIFSCVNGF
jgi:hypothetical protein